MIESLWDALDEYLIERDYRKHYAAVDRETAAWLALASGSQHDARRGIPQATAAIQERLARVEPVFVVRGRHVAAALLGVAVLLVGVL